MASPGRRSGKAEMFSAITTRPPMANTSLQALAAAMAPKSDGSSTSGGKKSVVDTMARSSLTRYTAASSNGASPTSRAGSALAASSRTSLESGAAPHFAAQPPQAVHSVSRLARSASVGHESPARRTGRSSASASPQTPGYGAAVMADLVVHDAELVATMDDDRRELAGRLGRHHRRDGRGGRRTARPERLTADATLDARGCLVTPGLINTHHHIYQNLTRAYRPATKATLFQWLTTLYPLWSRLDEEAAYVSAWVGLAELALGGCTTTTDHLYVHPRGAGDLITRRDHGCEGAGRALPPDAGLDEPLAEGRRPAPRQRRAGRRRDPGRLRAPRAAAPRPESMVRWCASPSLPARRSR